LAATFAIRADRGAPIAQYGGCDGTAEAGDSFGVRAEERGAIARPFLENARRRGAEPREALEIVSFRQRPKPQRAVAEVADGVNGLAEWRREVREVAGEADERILPSEEMDVIHNTLQQQAKPIIQYDRLEMPRENAMAHRLRLREEVGHFTHEDRALAETSKRPVGRGG
jgi:hypothetical protein